MADILKQFTKNLQKMDEAADAIERLRARPLLCHHSYNLPVSFGEYRRIKAAEARHG